MCICLVVKEKVMGHRNNQSGVKWPLVLFSFTYLALKITSMIMSRSLYNQVKNCEFPDVTITYLFSSYKSIVFSILRDKFDQDFVVGIIGIVCMCAFIVYFGILSLKVRSVAGRRPDDVLRIRKALTTKNGIVLWPLICSIFACALFAADAFVLGGCFQGDLKALNSQLANESGVMCVSNSKISVVNGIHWGTLSVLTIALIVGHYYGLTIKYENMKSQNKMYEYVSSMPDAPVEFMHQQHEQNYRRRPSSSDEDTSSGDDD